MIKEALFIFILFFSHLVFAQNKDRGAVTNTMVNANKAASDAFDTVTERLDLFLSGETYTTKKTKSTLTLKNEVYWLEGNGDEADFSSQFDIRLHLPNLEEKWALRFTSYDEDETERGVNRRRPTRTTPQENYGTSLAVLQKLGDFEITFRPRIKIKDNIETTHLLRIENKAEFTYVTFKPRLELYANSEVGTGQFLALNFEFPVAENFTFEIANEQEYANNNNLLSTNNEFALLQSLSDNQSLKYALLYQCDNKPNFHLVEYAFSIFYGHSILKNVLHYGVRPFVFFNEERSFRPKNGISLTFDLIF